MVNPTGKKLEKLLFGIFDEAIQGVDTYNHNGSMWLIFTDKMKWVVEYTKSQTLWYNYYFFKNEMEIIGLDCVENKDLIQKWFESRFLNMGEVKMIDDYIGQDTEQVENTIQNGVKHTIDTTYHRNNLVEDTIQNGVKDTRKGYGNRQTELEDTLDNGVKHTTPVFGIHDVSVENTLQNGVKVTRRFGLGNEDEIEDAIQNGIKHTARNNACADWEIKDVIENGVKRTSGNKIPGLCEIEDTIEKIGRASCRERVCQYV